MLWRLTNRGAWLSEPFAADTAHDLARGVRRAWYERLRAQNEMGYPVDDGRHPLLALRARLRAIDIWEAERLARPGATDALRQAWRAEAQHKRHWARRTARVDCGLHLLAYDDKRGGWGELPRCRGIRFDAPAHRPEWRDLLTRAHAVFGLLDGLDVMSGWLRQRIHGPLTAVDSPSQPTAPRESGDGPCWMAVRPLTSLPREGGDGPFLDCVTTPPCGDLPGAGI